MKVRRRVFKAIFTMMVVGGVLLVLGSEGGMKQDTMSIGQGIGTAVAGFASTAFGAWALSLYR